MVDIDAMRATNRAKWARDTHLPDYERQVQTAVSVYLPALEAEYDRLRRAAETAAGTCALCGVDIHPISAREYVDQANNKAAETPTPHEHNPTGPFVQGYYMLIPSRRAGV